MPSSASEVLRALATREPATQRRAAADVIRQARMADPGDAELRNKATALFARGWRELGPEQEVVLGVLVDALSDPATDLLVVNILAYAVASAGEDGLTELLSLLKHEDFAVRAYAAEGLGSLDNSARWAVPHLCRALGSAPSEWNTYVIVRALGNIGGGRALGVLQALADRERSAAKPDGIMLQVVEAALASALSQE